MIASIFAAALCLCGLLVGIHAARGDAWLITVHALGALMCARFFWAEVVDG